MEYLVSAFTVDEWKILLSQIKIDRLLFSSSLFLGNLENGSFWQYFNVKLAFVHNLKTNTKQARSDMPVGSNFDLCPASCKIYTQMSQSSSQQLFASHVWKVVRTFGVYALVLESDKTCIAALTTVLWKTVEGLLTADM